MNDPVSSRSGAPSGRKGVVVGILVAVLLMLLVYFYWRGTGYRDQSGRRPPPPGALPR